jgi:hypothetical protein
MFKYFFFFFFFLNQAESLELTKDFNTKIDRNIQFKISCNKNIFVEKIKYLKIYIDDQTFSLINYIDDQTFSLIKTGDHTKKTQLKVNKVKAFHDLNIIDNKNSFRLQSVLHSLFNIKNNKIQYFYDDFHFKKENVHSLSFSTTDLYKKNFDVIKIKLDKQRSYVVKNASIYFRSKNNLFQKINIPRYNIDNNSLGYIYLNLNHLNRFIAGNYFNDIYYITLFYKNNNSFEKKDFLKIKEITHQKDYQAIIINEKNLHLYYEINKNLLVVNIQISVPFNQLDTDNIFTSNFKKVVFKHQDENEICKLL